MCACDRCHVFFGCAIECVQSHCFSWIHGYIDLALCASSSVVKCDLLDYTIFAGSNGFEVCFLFHCFFVFYASIVVFYSCQGAIL